MRFEQEVQFQDVLHASTERDMYILRSLTDSRGGEQKQ